MGEFILDMPQLITAVTPVTSVMGGVTQVIHEIAHAAQARDPWLADQLEKNADALAAAVVANTEAAAEHVAAAENTDSPKQGPAEPVPMPVTTDQAGAGTAPVSVTTDQAGASPATTKAQIATDKTSASTAAARPGNDTGIAPLTSDQAGAGAGAGPVHRRGRS